MSLICFNWFSSSLRNSIRVGVEIKSAYFVVLSFSLCNSIGSQNYISIVFEFYLEFLARHEQLLLFFPVIGVCGVVAGIRISNRNNNPIVFLDDRPKDEPQLGQKY